MAAEKITRSDAMVDWRRLRPNRPLAPGSPEYAWRPEGWNGSKRLSTMIMAGMGPLVVTGPPGSGKTTELSATVAALRRSAACLYVLLDRGINPQKTSVAQALSALTRAALKQLGQMKFEPSSELRALLDPLGSESANLPDVPELLRRLVREARSRTRRRLVLVVDGMEKLEAPLTRELAETLRPLAQDLALVITAAPSAVIGPEAARLVHSYRVFTIGAAPVLLEFSGSAPNDAWKFLSAIALQRLGMQSWPENTDRYAYKAALCSGGLPRPFLQFLQDAVAFSVVAGHRRIMRGDMRLTYRQNHEAAIRLLKDGDLPAIEICRGTNGAELPLDARRRLLDLGLVLEYDNDGKTIVLPHPILTEYTVSPFVDQSFL